MLGLVSDLVVSNRLDPRGGVEHGYVAPTSIADDELTSVSDVGGVAVGDCLVGLVCESHDVCHSEMIS